MIVYPEFYMRNGELHSVKSMNVYSCDGTGHSVKYAVAELIGLETMEFKGFHIDIGYYDKQEYRTHAVNSLKKGYPIFLYNTRAKTLHFAMPSSKKLKCMLFHLFVDLDSQYRLLVLPNEQLVQYVYDFDMIAVRDPRIIKKV